MITVAVVGAAAVKSILGLSSCNPCQGAVAAVALSQSPGPKRVKAANLHANTSPYLSGRIDVVGRMVVWIVPVWGTV